MNYNLLAKSKLTKEQYLELAVHLKFLVGIATGNGFFANFMTSICHGDLSVDNLENLRLHIFANFVEPNSPEYCVSDDKLWDNVLKLDLNVKEIEEVVELRMNGKNFREACDIVLAKRTP